MPFHVSMDWTPFIARIVLKIIKFLNNPLFFHFPERKTLFSNILSNLWSIFSPSRMCESPQNLFLRMSRNTRHRKYASLFRQTDIIEQMERIETGSEIYDQYSTTSTKIGQLARTEKPGNERFR